jgi:hypothetical protein
MKFESCLENEDSFMIIPNEFVKDHELKREEAEALMQPDEAYYHERFSKYGGWMFEKTIAGRIKNFLKMDMTGKKIFIKKVLNRILSRELPKTEYKSIR